MKPTVNGVGSQIRQRRKRAGLNQAELALLVKVSQPTIAKYEHGSLRPSWPTMERLASVLKCEIRDLIPSGARAA